MAEYRLETGDLHKRFPGVYAVRGVSFEVRPGEVHALVGENGAGKSTLMKMINGELVPDAGHIAYNGERHRPSGVAEAKRLGVAMIHQELSPLVNMTIAQNIFLGCEICYGKSRVVNDAAMNAATRKVLAEYGMTHDPRTPVARLSVAHRQMLEIIKAVRSNASLIIMDEPTSSLSASESEKLFSLIRELVARDVSVIYISHRLEEVLNLSDRITVLRDGEGIGTVDASEVDQGRLIELMVGRPLTSVYPKENVAPGDVALEVRNLRVERCPDISFSVRRGEILGFAGLVGAGRSEVMRGIFGLDRKLGGEIFLDGRRVDIRRPMDAIRHGIAMVSEDRKEYGLVLCRSIRENIGLPNLPSLSRLGVLRSRDERRGVEDYRRSLGIKCATIDVDTGTLSGGNQQKVVLAKWLLARPKVLILDEPTRGIDVGAKFEIYKLMNALAAEGIAVVMISSEMPEVMGMSDRVLVMSDGGLTGEFVRDDFVSGRVREKDILASAFAAFSGEGK